MFIAIVGTPSSGKRTILDYLISKYGFIQVGLDEAALDSTGSGPVSRDTLDVPHVNGLTLSATSSPATTPTQSTPSGPLFPSVTALLDYTTRNWLTHHVTTHLRSFDHIEPFLKRPFFMLVSVDGPLLTRYERERGTASSSSSPASVSSPGLSLEQFISAHDLLLHGPPFPHTLPTTTLAHLPRTDFSRVMALASVAVCNNYPTVAALHAHLDSLDLMDEERLRPGWDTYFMTLASLASHRSNCMKRRVGALLVRSKRILSTGYNGTPRGVRNCNQGGCRRCNGSARGGEALDECLCLHAEENALLEAGRERIGDDSILYCNTCPCLRCSVKIVQTGVREVVYNQSYSMDAASAMVLKEGGVILRQLHWIPPPQWS